MRGLIRILLLLCLIAVRASGGEAFVPTLGKLQQPPAAVPDKAPKLAPLLVDATGAPIATRAGWDAKRTQLYAAWEQYLGSLPSKLAPLNFEVLDKEKVEGGTRQRVRYQVEDGVFTDGYLLVPEGHGPFPALVAFHATTRAHAKQPAGLEPGREEVAHGLHFMKRGYVVLCPRCFIFDDTQPDYKAVVKAVLDKHPGWRGMTRMLFDGTRAADVLESLPNVDKSRIGCIGHSLGAKEALYAAAFDERFKVAVFSEGGIGLRFSNWDAVWYLGEDINKPGFAREHHELLGLIAPRGFLWLGGESADNDACWPILESAHAVYKLLGRPESFTWLNHRGGHKYTPEARAAAEWFIDRELKK